jgi:hypothetical protein
MAEPLQFTVQGTEDLTRRLLQLGDDAPKAATRAVNRTLTSVRTLAARGLAAQMGVAQKRFVKSLRVARATFGAEIGTLTVGRKRVPLIHFMMSQRTNDLAYIYKGKYRDFPAVSGPFVRRMRSGHRGIFVRSTRPPERRGQAPREYPGSWLPIGEVYGPQLAVLFQRGLLPDALIRARDSLAANLDHEINWILTQRVQAGDE